MARLAVIVYIFSIFFIECIEGQFPENPCPEVFKYEWNDTTGSWQGAITLRNPPAYGTTFTVTVKIVINLDISDQNNIGSLVFPQNKDVSSQLIKERRPLKYTLNFPIADEIPRIKGIMVGNETLCNGADGTENITITLRNNMTTGIRISKKPDTQSRDDCGQLNTNFQLRNGDGSTINRGEWPWLVAILLKDPRSLFICAGTLISRAVVVTAAHCMYDDKSQMWDPDDLDVKAGANDLDDRYERNVQIMRVRSFKINSDYDKQTRLNDIAIVKTRDQVTYNDYVKPACLWTGNNIQSLVYSRSSTVAGWGIDEKKVPSTDGVRLVTSPIVTTAGCKASDSFFQATTSDKTLCVGKLGGSGPCSGDSGSGLFVRSKKLNVYQLRGIASNSPNSDTRVCTHYVVYTDVAKYDKWIKQEMDPN